MSRVNPAQMKKLLDLLSEDGVLVNGKVMYTDTNKQNFWKRIATQLNSVEGGVYKNTWKWCKMWADWKNKTKKKANILLRRKNYNFEHPTPTLTNLELRLLKLIDYPTDDKADAFRLEMVVNKLESVDNNADDFHMEFLTEDYSEIQSHKEKSLSSDEEIKPLEVYAMSDNKFCNVDNILHEDGIEIVEESSDQKPQVKLKGKASKNKKLISIEEYKIRTTLSIQKERTHQKSEELRLKAIELKLKGEELRLKELEMNKINYLTNIEEDKLKCFRDISSSLKELLERTRTNNNRFQNSL